ncbi:hypothetical protein [Rothia mucilaginosa]|uniref:hypothetical protein n=1 Tax=Rothia mucilaginosa TaxID=43675 RepID=UPI0026F308FB|nr:hypothetical protein [Rothia mucilaginosa]
MTAGPLFLYLEASMKAPLKRKGNPPATSASHAAHRSLNESPSEKEGKSVAALQFFKGEAASMKAPPKRKGKSVGQSATQAAGSLKESPSKKEREM